MKKPAPQRKDRIRINQEIRAKELRVIGAQGENLGVLALGDALQAAKDTGLDLIEFSPSATPPVAKIMDYGKFQYEQSKQGKEIKTKAKSTETKSVQIKMNTGEHDMLLKAKRSAEWLEEGHRVKVELFLKGRHKYMDQVFLKSRLEKFLLLIPYSFRIADDMKPNPKGLALVIERDGSKRAIEGRTKEQKPKETVSETKI